MMWTESVLRLLGMKAMTNRRRKYETIINTTQSVGIGAGADTR